MWQPPRLGRKPGAAEGKMIEDRFGQPVKPKEWFLVPLVVIDEVVDKIRDGSIIEFEVDTGSHQENAIEQRSRALSDFAESESALGHGHSPVRRAPCNMKNSKQKWLRRKQLCNERCLETFRGANAQATFRPKCALLPSKFSMSAPNGGVVCGGFRPPGSATIGKTA